MDQSEADKWAVGSDFPADVDTQHQASSGPGFVDPMSPGGTPSGGGGVTGGAAGWARQNARFLHLAAPLRHTRFVHDTVTAGRLTAEDIKKAREAKQGAAKQPRQKVRCT